jgi:bifunctional DNA-binding transcriptional regulator/antitoxin component of YhaV-PrlF toxin-antitoxin module
MSVKGKYYVPPKVFAVSKVFQHGKTQVPKEVREVLKLEDGDRILWFNEDGKIFVQRLQ